MVKITLGVDGMACGMCESHINDEIRKNYKVKKVSSSHGKGGNGYHRTGRDCRGRHQNVIAATGYEMTSYKSEPYEKKGLFSRKQ